MLIREDVVNLALCTHATFLEEDVARSYKGAEIHHLGKNVGQLLFSGHEHDFSPAMDHKIAQVKLPAKKMCCLRRDTEFIREVISSTIVDE